MAEKKGKVTTLLTDNKINTKVDLDGQVIEEVDITLIDRKTDQPRKTFKEDSIKELASSIEKYGVLQPLILEKKGERYEIIAGERRFRAAHQAKLKKVPAIVRQLTEKQKQEIALIENIQREDLNAIEIAEGIRELIDKYGLKQEDVAQQIGKSRPYVTNILRLLQLPTKVADMVRSGELSPGNARALIQIDDEEYLVSLARQAVEKQLTVREVERSVKTYFARKAIPGGPRKEEPMPLELKEIVSDMKRIFATKVKLKGNENKGMIVINYYTRDDIDRIYTLMQILKLNERL